MTPSVANGHLPRDPRPGSIAWDLEARNLDTLRIRLERLRELERRLPDELTDCRFRIRDCELRLGLPPSYPAPGPGPSRREGEPGAEAMSA
jgi:hypothetical protein